MRNWTRALPRIGRLVALAGAIALVAACASGPEPSPAPDAEYDEAKALRARINDNDLSSYATDEYEAGEAAFAAGESAYESEDYATAQAEFDTSIANYREVIRIAYRSIAGSRKSDADRERARADEIKASIAVAEQYAEAIAIYEEAAAAEANGDDETAADLYENAVTLFIAVYDAAAEKRDAALEALDRATERTAGLEGQREALEQEARDDLDAADAAAEGSTDEGDAE